MEKSEELQIATSGKNMDIHRMELLPVVCLSVYKEIIKEMAELIEDKQIREIFCSLSLGKDLLCVSQITGISSKNLVSMYKRGNPTDPFEVETLFRIKTRTRSHIYQMPK